MTIVERYNVVKRKITPAKIIAMPHKTCNLGAEREEIMITIKEIIQAAADFDHVRPCSIRVRGEARKTRRAVMQVAYDAGYGLTTIGRALGFKGATSAGGNVTQVVARDHDCVEVIRTVNHLHTLFGITPRRVKTVTPPRIVTAGRLERPGHYELPRTMEAASTYFARRIRQELRRAA